MEARIASIAGDFDEQDAGLAGTDPLHFDGYARQIERAREDSGDTEACKWGWASVDGVECALIVMDFGFIGGSMGVAVGEKVARAYDAARKRRLPVVAVTASGGARMQEGMVALVQMAKTAEARRRHADAGLAQVTVLSSPTTGGVYASFASLGDVVIAAPDTTVGFAGPRVVEELTGARPDPRVHRAEFALDHGLIDAIVPVADQRSVVASVLESLDPRTPDAAAGASSGGAASEEHAASAPALSAWEKLALAREPRRPKARQIVGALLASCFELHGDRTGAADDDTVVACVGLTRASSGRQRSVAVIAQDASGGARIRPSGYRKAVRTIEMAGRLGLPVVTVIDTRGADPLPSSEGHGVAAAIARTFLALLACPSPTLAVVTGEGGSGGALAMAVCDRVVVWENAVFSVIAPEGAASILHRDASRAPELAEQLRITADDLVRLRIADGIEPEPPGGAHTDPAGAADALAKRIERELDDLAAAGRRRRLAARHRRWRSGGIEHIRR